MYKYRFSVFTATYNRAHLLDNVYKCLLNQTLKDFEWVIVDDGSMDNTEEVCRNFIAEGVLNIKYIRKENGGKHTAWRAATNVFEGQYVIGADDDDVYPAEMLEVLNCHWSNLEKQSDYADYWEVKGRCAYADGNLVGKPLPETVFDSDYNSISYKLKYRSEMQGCRKVEVLKNEAAVPMHFLYEENCSNFPEGIRWSRAARRYKTRFIDHILRIYNVGTEGGLCAKNSGKERSSKKTYNTLVGSIYNLAESRDLLLKYDKISYIKTLAVLVYASLCLKKSPFSQTKLTVFEKLILICIYLPLYCIYLYRK